MLNLWRWNFFLLLLPCIVCTWTANAQIDPVERQLVQIGYNQPLEGHPPPLAGYAFYYYNQPSFIRTNLTLRLAVAPVYLDSELGFLQALGPNTDFGLGLAGGGYANSYVEINQGKYLPGESFLGHGGSLSGSIYHRFNPAQEIPLNGVFRASANYAAYLRDTHTADNFELPNSGPFFKIRTGLRWGGTEPLLAPDLGLELSAWYEGTFRVDPGRYGFADDRDLNTHSHLFWARALLAYTLPERKDNFFFSVTAGTSLDPDRISAYRLGGVLPLASEFPLSLPGYYYQELSARNFILVNGTYYLPLDARKRWELTATASTAMVDYMPGLSQAVNWNSGIGGGLTYRSNSGAWRIFMGYGYGFDAIRSGGRGAQSIGFLVQFDLAHTREDTSEIGASPSWSRGFDRILRSFQ